MVFWDVYQRVTKAPGSSRCFFAARCPSTSTPWPGPRCRTPSGPTSATRTARRRESAPSIPSCRGRTCYHMVYIILWWYIYGDTLYYLYYGVTMVIDQYISMSPYWYEWIYNMNIYTYEWYMIIWSILSMVIHWYILYMVYIMIIMSPNIHIYVYIHIYVT